MGNQCPLNYFFNRSQFIEIHHLVLKVINVLIIQQIISPQKSMSSTEKQKNNQTLHKLMQNSQQLTHIRHIGQNDNEHEHQKMDKVSVCPLSVTKILIQGIYLLYTCKILKLDLYLSLQPIFILKLHKCLCQVQLIFFLRYENTEDYCHLLCKRCQFVLLQPHNFNKNATDFFLHFINKVQHLMQQNLTYERGLKSNILKFRQQLQSLANKILDNPSFQIIKSLQETQFFNQNSKLLKILRSSILYRIKKKQTAINLIKELKIIRQTHFLKMIRENSLNTLQWKFYKNLDLSLYKLAEEGIISLYLSQIENFRLKNQLLAGELQQTSQNNRKYCLNFYYLDRPIKCLKRQQRNLFVLQYQFKQSIILIKYITSLQASSQTVDSISQHICNICFQNLQASIVTIEIARNPQKSKTPKKYIAFQIKSLIGYEEEPLIKTLIMIEHVTICAKTFMELMIQKPFSNQATAILEISLSLEHLLKNFVLKAARFYELI